MNPLAYGGLVILISICFFGCLTSVMGTTQPYFDALITVFVTHWVMRDLVPVRQENYDNNENNDDVSRQGE
jgi:hypothetical protein